MVHGLINHHKLGQAVMTLKGYQEEFALSKTEKVSMAEWNPLLVAVAFKKLDIVRYFTQQLKISVKHFGRSATDEQELTSEQNVNAQLFALTLAIANKDGVLFSELWNINFSAWEQAHADKLLALLIEAKWVQGLTTFFKSYTAETLFATVIPKKQYDILK